MECGGSSSMSNKGKKVASTRRTWNQYEEQLLMEQLKELLTNGHWKTENGFRPGYQHKLEQMMREKIPGTDIRVSPHINSRITIWKRHHVALQLAVGSTGTGFNTLTKVIDVSDDAWAKVVQKEPSVSGMRYKPWPFYYDWMEVFGCDAANGKTADDIIDVVNDLVNDDIQTKCDESIPAVNEVVSDDSNAACEMDVESQSPTIDTTKQASMKKRTSPSQTSNNKELFDGLAIIFKESDEQFLEMIKHIGSEPQVPQAKETLYEMVEKIPNLSLDELLDVCENLSRNPTRLEMFIGLPEHTRPRYVRRLLNGDFDK